MMKTQTILKFIERKASIQEQEEVLTWLESSKDHQQEFARLKNLCVAIDIMSSERKKSVNKIHKIFRWSAKIAAALIIAVSIFYFGEAVNTRNWEKQLASQYFQITAPFGEILTFTLPDSSKITLNSGSTIKYSNLYGYNDRTVYLSGEGYFEVKKASKKFNVIYPLESPLFKTTVLGTSFNISSYPEDKDIVTDLYEGSIQIENLSKKESAIMTPNTRYTYNKSNSESSIEAIQDTYRWTDHYVVAESEDIESFSKKLERIFNVDIVVAPELAGICTYNGVLYGESLRQILDHMTFVSPIKYSITDNGKTVLIQLR